MKHCNGCNSDLPLTSFHKKGEGKYHSKCKKCVNYRSRIWRTETGRDSTYNPVVRRRYLLKKNYGITLEKYDEMFNSQGGVCGICATDTPGGNGSFYVDHSHDTGEIRGLLCHHCNFLLGNAKENLETLHNAALYLLKTKDVLF